MAAWEAIPADLVTLVACRRAAGGGVGTGRPWRRRLIAEVLVTIDFRRMPEGGVPFNQSVSAGTVASIIEMLADPLAGLVGRPEALLPAQQGGDGRPGALRLAPGELEGRVLGPVVPVDFLNPSIVHRTAALLAAERGVRYRPARYLEGVDTG